MCNFCLGSKVLLSAGCNLGCLSHQEILDLKTDKCLRLPSLPRPKCGITGGLLGEIPVVIGGDEDDEVLKIGTAIIPFQSQLSKKRFLAATTPKNQSLWVTGGKDASFKDSKLKSTDIIQRDGTIVVGPELPLALSQHAIVEIQPDETYMLIGGNTDDAFASKVTFVYHARIGKWTKGPDLLQGRYAHSAGILHDIATHHPYTVVVGGIQNHGSELLSVEFLRSGSLCWTQGKHIHVLHFPNMYLGISLFSRSTFTNTTLLSPNGLLEQQPCGLRGCFGRCDIFQVTLSPTMQRWQIHLGKTRCTLVAEKKIFCCHQNHREHCSEVE